jgi:hypothetical protein
MQDHINGMIFHEFLGSSYVQMKELVGRVCSSRRRSRKAGCSRGTRARTLARSASSAMYAQRYACMCHAWRLRAKEHLAARGVEIRK